jgi:excisionase family DNA binding protein
MGMIAERQTLSILQACERVNVSRRTIYNWMARGKVEYVRTAGGSVRIFSDTLWRAPEEVTPRPGLTSPAGKHVSESTP